MHQIYSNGFQLHILYVVLKSQNMFLNVKPNEISVQVSYLDTWYSNMGFLHSHHQVISNLVPLRAIFQ